jgi:O-antigen/teichoic acid export membrane protein
VLVNLGLNFAFVPAFGARAAAVNSTLSYALIFLLVAWYFCRKTGRRPAEIFVPRPQDLRDLFVRVRLANVHGGQNRLR